MNALLEHPPVLYGWKCIADFMGRSERWLREIASRPDYPNPLPLRRPGLRRGQKQSSVTMVVTEAAVWRAREGLGPMPRHVEVILSCGCCQEATEHRFAPRYECLSCGTMRSV